MANQELFSCLLFVLNRHFMYSHYTHFQRTTIKILLMGLNCVCHEVKLSSPSPSTVFLGMPPRSNPYTYTLIISSFL